MSADDHASDTRDRLYQRAGSGWDSEVTVSICGPVPAAANSAATASSGAVRPAATAIVPSVAATTATTRAILRRVPMSILA